MSISFAKPASARAPPSSSGTTNCWAAVRAGISSSVRAGLGRCGPAGGGGSVEADAPQASAGR